MSALVQALLVNATVLVYASRGAFSPCTTAYSAAGQCRVPHHIRTIDATRRRPVA